MNTPDTTLQRYRLNSDDALPAEVLAGFVKSPHGEFSQFQAFPIDAEGRVCGEPTTWAKPDEFHALYGRVE